MIGMLTQLKERDGQFILNKKIQIRKRFLSDTIRAKERSQLKIALVMNQNPIHFQ